MGGRLLAQRISVRTGACVGRPQYTNQPLILSLSLSALSSHFLIFSFLVVTIVGGFVFLFFAITGLFMEDNGEGQDLADKIQNAFAGTVASAAADDV